MIEIQRLNPIDELRADPSPLAELWLALFDHHVSTGAAGMPTRPRTGSWPQRRDHYLDTVAGSPHASLWVALETDRPVGYALSFEDTLDGEPVEVLETLSLLPGTRGKGLGTELVRGVEDDARARGIRRVAIDVMGGNDGALRFYERSMYRPYSVTWMRSLPPATDAVEALDLASPKAGDARAAFAELGLALTATGQSDDTWATAGSVATVAIPTIDAAGESSPVAWVNELERGADLLGAAGFWTVWFEMPASALTAPEGPIGGALAHRGFHHGMSRVVKAI
ncbi:GNAT family N-acetyltransferase [Leucobacter aridicollis]|uniref:GNAT family N-acetyltransferase n=1 Tax=Leucobacter aridicollis TaxID=283878 RepID=UPI002106C3AF|nr:GNAT family N-acetyltransferase [Leucobacter aridicollis]UTX54473.1 GNAT family N-acetyltransferase [Leucobacter aridicollis]